MRDEIIVGIIAHAIRQVSLDKYAPIDDVARSIFNCLRERGYEIVPERAPLNKDIGEFFAEVDAEAIRTKAVVVPFLGKVK